MNDLEDDEGPANRHVCVDCGRLSPATTTTITLISARHGWRMTLKKDHEGRQSPEWRCPSCWQKFRGSRGP